MLYSLLVDVFVYDNKTL